MLLAPQRTSWPASCTIIRSWKTQVVEDSVTSEPFWPRRSPHFAKLRALVRPVVRGATRPVAVGLSGGPDSLALAAAVAAEAGAAGVRAVALCVDHQLQEGSRAVSERAAAQARAWGMDAKVLSVEVDGTGEAAARVARYHALAQENVPVLIAHTAEDQAETLLLSALRGHVAGMSTRTVVEGCEVIRPLLDARREDTEAACRELGVEPWRDPHNSLDEFRRVRIRREVLPLLSDIVSGDAVGALAEAAAAVAADGEYLDTPANVDCVELAQLPGPRRMRAIRAWLLDNDVDVTRAALRAIEKLCVDWHGQGGVAVKSPRSDGMRLEVRRLGGKLALLPGN